MQALNKMTAHGFETVHRSSIEMYLRLFPGDRWKCERAIREGRLRILEDVNRGDAGLIRSGKVCMEAQAQ